MEKSRSRAPVYVGALSLALMAGAGAAGKLPWLLPGVYLAASAVAFLAYWFDKSAARNGRWRTPESTLHLYGVLCGWPGALAAQTLLRHKSKKTAFLLTFWGTVVVNCAALFWLLRAEGAADLRVLLGF